MEDLTSKIDQYLSGEMSSDETKQFEAEVKSNESLREELNLQMKVVAMLDESAWLETKDQVAQLSKKKSSPKIYVQMLKVAAVLAVILLPTYYLVHQQYTDQNLYASYESAYPDRITTMGDSEENITKAMSAYNNEKFGTAAKAFEELRVSGDSRFTIYEAISLQRNKKNAAAIALLKSAIETQPENVSAYQWQLILTYLADDQGDKAHALLEDYVKNNDGYQAKKAKQLLDDLNSFWR